jgi:hypothetical protein
MPGTRESLRLHLKPGMLVTHRIHGVGRVLGEWGPGRRLHRERSRASCSCAGIYGVRFGTHRNEFSTVAGAITCRGCSNSAGGANRI